ncbi:MAG: sigma-70 family RNA polymerase sigma factor [Mycobacterium sp.]
MTSISSFDQVRAGQVRPDFEREVMPLLADLRRRALAYTHNAADAEDLVQETLLKAYRAFATLGRDRYLKAWLLRIMRNTWINNYRAGLCRPTEALVGDLTDGNLDIVSQWSRHECSAEHIALRGMADPGTVAALSSLPEKVLLTVYYIAIVGLSYREVSTAMNVPPGTVMSRMHRGRLLLRRSLAAHRGGLVTIGCVTENATAEGTEGAARCRGNSLA